MLVVQLFSAHPLYPVLWIAAVVLALTVHEFSHGLAARLQGDSTAEYEGRLTLNPLAHIDWLGFALLIFIGFGWAKPTPFNPYNLKYKRFGPALVGIAGPLSNILFTIVIGLVLALVHSMTGIGAENMMVNFFVLLMYINLLLAVFNLIPIPPLDGAKVLYSFIAHRRPDIVMFLERYGTWILLIFIFGFSGVIGRLFFFFFNLMQTLIAAFSPATATLVLDVLFQLGFIAY